jgi:hypothetical protein
MFYSQDFLFGTPETQEGESIKPVEEKTGAMLWILF